MKTASRPVSLQCMNCDTTIQGKYCHSCGQRASTRRLRFRQLLITFVEGLIDLDSKTLRTAWALFTRPGQTARSYVEGARVRYLSPLRYYVLVVAFNIGLSALIDAVAGTAAEGGFWDTNFVALQISLIYAVVAFLLAVCQWLLHRSSTTLAEHYAFLLYLLAQSVLVIALVQPLAQALGVPPR